MTARKISPLDYTSAERKLNILPIPPHDRRVLETTLQAINEATDSHHLELIMAHASGLLQGLTLGLVLKPDVLVQVGELFEAVAQYERARMVV